VKTLATYKQKQDDNEEDDGDVEKSNKSKWKAIGSKEGNIGTNNWIAGVCLVFFLEVATSYIKTQQLKVWK
jgi:hypothetical protein